MQMESKNTQTLFMYMCLACLFCRYTDESQKIKYFVYLTNWAFLTLGVSVLINAIVVTVTYFRKG